jgi:DNA helicase IV
MRERAEDPTASYTRDVEVHRLEEHIVRLRAASQSLCFGRIDGADDAAAADGTDRSSSRPLYVGRTGIRGEDGEILLVDWRADAARPFYTATHANPMDLHRRRHLKLRGRTVVDVTDELLDGSRPGPQDVVGDGPLAEALGGARTGRMREAASTLQAEQDRIVRSDHRGVTVVDGGPGTGKTIVALHRAAYVLYAWPHVAERGVLVFGPNQRFLTYISEVLPSLGENDVRLATLADLVGIQADRSESDHVARLKGRQTFAAALADWVGRQEPHGVPLELATAHDTVVLDPGIIDEARERALRGSYGHNHARALFLEYVVEDLVTELEVRSTREDQEYERALLDQLGIDLDRVVASDLGGEGAGYTELAIDWEQLRDELLVDPVIDRAVERIWPRLDAEDTVRAFLADHAAVASALADDATGEVSEEDLATGEVSEEDPEAITRGARAGWTGADLALIDEARALLDGPPHEVFGHLVVDEAQQLSAMQWRVLMRRCPDRSLTVVGDLAQAGPTTNLRSWEEALAPFVQDRFERHTLTINYRTTAEILESTRTLLARIAPDQQLSQSIRHGETPRNVTAPHGKVEQTAQSLITEARAAPPEELIGLVTTADAAPQWEQTLDEQEVAVVGAPDVRGLEFDTVIVVDPVAVVSASDAGPRDLYVAQTRATQRLIFLVPSGQDGR